MSATQKRNPNGPAVIVDPYSSGALFAPAFREAGVDVVAVVSASSPPAVYAASYRPEDFAEIITYEGDLAPVVARLLAIGPRCVLPGCESGVELADALAPLVTSDVANEPSLASARRHKGDMASAVAAKGLPMIPQLCTRDPRAVESWIAVNGLHDADLVVKPPKSASTDGVTFTQGGTSWREAFDALLGKPNRLGIVNDRVLVQEYAVGTEYVVDTFSYEGIHTVTDVCRYQKVKNGPHLAVYDSMTWLTPDDAAAAEVVAYAKGVLDAVGLRFGAAHVEVMLTARGPRLIEVGARPHGGGQPRFCRVATGDSQVDRTVRYFTSAGAIPESYTLKKLVQVVFLIGRAEGIAENAEIFDAVKQLPSHHLSMVNLRNHDRVHVTKDLFGSLDLGFVVLAHDSHDQVRADYLAIRGIERQLRVAPLLEGTAKDCTDRGSRLPVLTRNAEISQ